MAQFSVGIGIPLWGYILLGVSFPSLLLSSPELSSNLTESLPSSVSTLTTLALEDRKAAEHQLVLSLGGLCFVTGALISWCGTVNNLVMAVVVPVSARSAIYGLDRVLEGYSFSLSLS